MDPLFRLILSVVKFDGKSDSDKVNTPIALATKRKTFYYPFKWQTRKLKVYDSTGKVQTVLCQVQKCYLYENSKFDQHVQESDETVNAFITAQYRLVETCSYGQLSNEMIMDQIVVEICDNAVSERLQLNPQLKLESFQVTRLNQALKT